MPGLIGVGVDAASGVFNAISQQESNRKNREFTEHMYDRTKQDNLEFWNMQNAYNTPASQMQRYKDANLNPNLIYGSSGDNSAGNIPSGQVVQGSNRPVSVEPRGMSSMLMMADLKIKQAQANNLIEQTEVIRQDATLRRVQAQQAGFDFDYANEFRGLNADGLYESVRQKRVGSDLAINRDAREAIANSASVSEAAARTLNLIEQNKGFSLEREHTSADTDRIRQNIIQMQKDGRLKDFEIMLNKANVSKSDPLWQRIIADFFSSGRMDTLKETISGDGMAKSLNPSYKRH
jgi:hypothetical protein